MLHCGIDCWDESMELCDVVDYRYLANIASIQDSNLFTDIIFCWCQVK